MEAWAADHRVDALVTTGDNVYERGEGRRSSRPSSTSPTRSCGAPGRCGRPSATTTSRLATAPTARSPSPTARPALRQVPAGLQLLFLDANRAHREQASWLDAACRSRGRPCGRRSSTSRPGRAAATTAASGWSGAVRPTSRTTVALSSPATTTTTSASCRPKITYVVTGGGGQGLYQVDSCAAGTAVRRGGPPPLHRRGGPRRLAHRRRGPAPTAACSTRRSSALDVDLEPDRPAARALPHWQAGQVGPAPARARRPTGRRVDAPPPSAPARRRPTPPPEPPADHHVADLEGAGTPVGTDWSRLVTVSDTSSWAVSQASEPRVRPPGRTAGRRHLLGTAGEASADQGCLGHVRSHGSPRHVDGWGGGTVWSASSPAS